MDQYTVKSLSEKRLERENNKKSLEQIRRANGLSPKKKEIVLPEHYGPENSELVVGVDNKRRASDLGRFTLEKAKQAAKDPDTLELFKDRYECEIENISDGNYKIRTKVKNSGNFQYDNIINAKDGIITLKYNYKTHDINHGGSGALYHSHVIYNQLLLVTKEYGRDISNINLKEVRIEHILNVKSTQILELIAPPCKELRIWPRTR